MKQTAIEVSRLCCRGKFVTALHMPGSWRNLFLTKRRSGTLRLLAENSSAFLASRGSPEHVEGDSLRTACGRPARRAGAERASASAERRFVIVHGSRLAR